jgi:enamine deaminase RidA (YjgF/YER057c/UK114 family)
MASGEPVGYRPNPHHFEATLANLATGDMLGRGTRDRGQPRACPLWRVALGPSHRLRALLLAPPPRRFGGSATMRRLISSGSTFERDIGYSRAVVDGEWVFVSGTTGFDHATMAIAEDVASQAEQCLRNIERALAEAGCSFEHVVRVRYVLPRAEDFPACWPALRRAFGDVRPAATMIAAGLADPRMRIEVEVTARRAVGDG